MTGVSVERLRIFKKKKAASFTLCALTVTSGAEASKLRRRGGEATRLLNRDSDRRWHATADVQSSGVAVTVTMCLLFYLLYLFISVNTTK